MNLDQFVAAWSGKFCDIDKYYGAQCWDIVEQYAEDVLKVPRNPWAITLNPGGVAKNAWLNFDENPQLIKYFAKIAPGREIRGDITVYDGHGVYTEGHIAICLEGTQVFEQNADPDSSPAHTANRPRTYLLGSLRLKGSTVAYRDMTPQEVSEDYSNYTNGHVVVKASDPACQGRKENIPASDGGEFWRGLNNQQLQIIQQLDARVKELEAGGGKFKKVDVYVPA